MHTHIGAPPPVSCEDPDLWDLTNAPPRVDRCRVMTLVWYHFLSGVYAERGMYRCRDLRCRYCAPERISAFLAKLPQLWTQTVWLAQPTGQWERQWDGVLRTFRAAGHDLEYMVIKRRDYRTNQTETHLWASTPVPFPQAIPDGGWTAQLPDRAVRVLRDQLCLPGPYGRFPPPRSRGWSFPAAPAGSMPPGWKRFVLDPLMVDRYEECCETYAREFGVRPKPDVVLPDPAAFQQRLMQARILHKE